MAEIGSLVGHTLWVECKCGATSRVRIGELVVRLGAHSELEDVVARMRCRRCKTKMPRRWLVSYSARHPAAPGDDRTVPLPPIPS